MKYNLRGFQLKQKGYRVILFTMVASCCKLKDNNINYVRKRCIHNMLNTFPKRYPVLFNAILPWVF